jgi:pimeloyl-ACP methyl ester carboxylesterase
VTAANGIDYAYRDVGEGSPPLVLLQHFRGNLDNRDPALVDALAAGRRVVTFDNVGVGGSTGSTPGTVTQMAVDAIAFMEAMELEEVDVPGFSIGSLVAQEIALIRPGGGPPAGARVLRSPMRRRHARLGARSDRGRRRASSKSSGVPGRVFHAVGHQPPGRFGDARAEHRPQ